MTDANLEAGAAGAEGNGAGGAGEGAGAAEAGQGAAGGQGDGKNGAGDAGKVADGKDASLAAGGGDDGKNAAPQDWPDDWRQKLAGEDKKLLERLGRYSSPGDVAKALAETQDKVRQGLKPRERPGDKATDDEWAAYRKEVGIPETVEKFVESIKLPDGRKIGDNDKPLVEAFSERAHKIGIQPSDMSALIDEYYAIEEERVAQQQERDAEFKAKSQNELRQEWGGEYKANVNAMRPYFEGVDAELFDNLMGGRLADGSKIGDHPGMIRFFVAKALAENPAATVVPAGGDQMKTIDDEIASYEKRMRDDRAAWFKDTAAQERYQKLVAAKEKLATK